MNHVVNALLEAVLPLEGGAHVVVRVSRGDPAVVEVSVTPCQAMHATPAHVLSVLSSQRVVAEGGNVHIRLSVDCPWVVCPWKGDGEAAVHPAVAATMKFISEVDVSTGTVTWIHKGRPVSNKVDTTMLNGICTFHLSAHSCIHC